MEVSGQLHAPATLLQGKESLIPIGQGTGWSPEPVWTWWRRERKSQVLYPVVRGRKGVDWIYLAQNKVHWKGLVNANEPSFLIQEEEFLDRVSDYQLLKRNAAPRSMNPGCSCGYRMNIKSTFLK
jgi:hypothetical protein